MEIKEEVPKFQSTSPRTYEQGLAAGMRKMAEAACKAVCMKCRHLDKGRLCVEGIKNGNLKCWWIRCAAQDLGIDLSAAPNECNHERLNEDGICRSCGADKRGIG